MRNINPYTHGFRNSNEPERGGRRVPFQDLICEQSSSIRTVCVATKADLMGSHSFV